jgi:hypothetical protein
MIGLRGLLLLVALVLFVIGIFSDVHQGDLICAGLAVWALSLLVEAFGWDMRMGNARTNT